MAAGPEMNKMTPDWRKPTSTSALFRPLTSAPGGRRRNLIVILIIIPTGLFSISQDFFP